MTLVSAATFGSVRLGWSVWLLAGLFLLGLWFGLSGWGLACVGLLLCAWVLTLLVWQVRLKGLVVSLLVLLALAAPIGGNVKFGQVGWLIPYRLFLAMLVATAVVYVACNGGLRARRVGFLLLFPIFWLIWGIISLCWAENMGFALRYVGFLAVGTITAVAVGFFCETRRSVLAVVGASLASYLSGLGIGYFESRLHFRLPVSGLVGAPERYSWMVSSYFRNPNDFGTYITLFAPFFLAFFLLPGRWVKKAGAFCVLALAGYCLLYTGSKANIVALLLEIVGLCAVAAVLGVRKSVRVAVLIVMLLGTVAVRGGVIGAMSATQLRDINLLLPLGYYTRQSELRISLAGVGEAPLLGYGAGNAEVDAARRGRVHTSTHNLWLETALDFGVPFLALFLLWYVRLMMALFGVMRRAAEPWLLWVSASLLLSLFGFVVGSTSPSSVIAWKPMWVVLGLSIAVVRMAKEGIGVTAERVG